MVHSFILFNWTRKNKLQLSFVPIFGNDLRTQRKDVFPYKHIIWLGAQTVGYERSLVIMLVTSGSTYTAQHMAPDSYSEHLNSFYLTNHKPLKIDNIICI